MRQKIKRNPFDLTDTEIDAIICALATIEAFPCESASQMQVNLFSRDAAVAKLKSRAQNYTPNEIRIISCAIDGVILYLSGNYPEVTLDADLEKAVSKNLFVYNYLAPRFRHRVSDLEKKFLRPDLSETNN